MRYLIAMVFGVAGAALAMYFLSGPIADWAALQFKYDSSDGAENVNQIAFMAINLAGLAIGWTIGWAVGAPLDNEKRAQ